MKRGKPSSTLGSSRASESTEYSPPKKTKTVLCDIQLSKDLSKIHLPSVKAYLMFMEGSRHMESAINMKGVTKLLAFEVFVSVFNRMQANSEEVPLSRFSGTTMKVLFTHMKELQSTTERILKDLQSAIENDMPVAVGPESVQDNRNTQPHDNLYCAEQLAYVPVGIAHFNLEWVLSEHFAMEREIKVNRLEINTLRDQVASLQQQRDELLKKVKRLEFGFETTNDDPFSVLFSNTQPSQ